MLGKLPGKHQTIYLKQNYVIYQPKPYFPNFEGIKLKKTASFFENLHVAQS